ncbi:Peroxisomal sarcosine oxidase [Bagarius yarrelli]|uniref:Peroxisomal sarcosine oxidase n=1 Tax=Bagarius yarrelli TaxID=175774 RepID=A0A556U6X6_BAGYA|nr:Peroxisomal sarcosine oxidase [Bagarius yarrelli]
MGYECIVIGAGIQGSFTAYHLAKNNKKTLLLEQFVLPHSRGSSHGQTRIIRKAYEDDFYIHMLEESYELWVQLEHEAGVKLYRQTGLLLMGPENAEDLQLIKNSMQRNKVPSVVLERHEFSQHIPSVNLTSGNEAIVETSAGILYADRALRAVQTVFQSHGGEIKDGEKVINIEPGDVITVTTDSGTYQAKNLVITAGPWAKTLLSHTGLQLPLKVLKINVCYWKEKVPGTYSIKNRFPCFIQLQPKEAQHDIYGLPSNEYPGLMKVSILDNNCDITETWQASNDFVELNLLFPPGFSPLAKASIWSETEPDERDRQKDRRDIDALSSYISCCFPGLVPVPAVEESCMYTVTPDKHFVLDRHPAYSNIVIGAGFSGHGFKFGPVVGKVLCELSMGQNPSYDLSPFSIQRFRANPE